MNLELVSSIGPALVQVTRLHIDGAAYDTQYIIYTPRVADERDFSRDSDQNKVYYTGNEKAMLIVVKK